KGIGDFNTANSESGHEGQNAFSQGRGGREDPCTNVPPPDLKQPGPKGRIRNGGSYCYSATLAPCTDHFGDSNTKGRVHERICRKEEEYSENLKAGRVSEKKIGEGVEQSADVLAKGPNPDQAAGKDLKEAKKNKKLVELLKKAQEEQAEVLAEKYGCDPN